MKSLSSNTDRLPKIPEKIIGTNTVEALQPGIMHGYEEMVQYIIKKTKNEMEGKPKVVAKGGLSFIFEPLHHVFDEIQCKPYLGWINYDSGKIKKFLVLQVKIPFS